MVGRILSLFFGARMEMGCLLQRVSIMLNKSCTWTFTAMHISYGKIAGDPLRQRLVRLPTGIIWPLMPGLPMQTCGCWKISNHTLPALVLIAERKSTDGIE